MIQSIWWFCNDFAFARRDVGIWEPLVKARCQCAKLSRLPGLSELLRLSHPRSLKIHQICQQKFIQLSSNKSLILDYLSLELVDTCRIAQFTSSKGLLLEEEDEKGAAHCTMRCVHWYCASKEQVKKQVQWKLWEKSWWTVLQAVSLVS